MYGYHLKLFTAALLALFSQDFHYRCNGTIDLLLSISACRGQIPRRIDPLKDEWKRADLKQKARHAHSN